MGTLHNCTVCNKPLTGSSVWIPEIPMHMECVVRGVAWAARRAIQERVAVLPDSVAVESSDSAEVPPASAVTSPIELATAEELVQELQKRTTFRGILLYQRESYKNAPDINWRYRYKNLSKEVVVKMLRELADKLEKGQDEPFAD